MEKSELPSRLRVRRSRRPRPTLREQALSALALGVLFLVCFSPFWGPYQGRHPEWIAWFVASYFVALVICGTEGLIATLREPIRPRRWTFRDAAYAAPGPFGLAAALAAPVALILLTVKGGFSSEPYILAVALGAIMVPITLWIYPLWVERRSQQRSRAS